MSSIAEVKLWGSTIGVVALKDDSVIPSFQYTSDFVKSQIEIAPLTMPLRLKPYRFPELPRAAFHGLPGLLADSLPDKFGTILINAWLMSKGHSPDDFNAVQRLCYLGTRSTGALEFSPLAGPSETTSQKLQIDTLVRLTSDILSQRGRLSSIILDRPEAFKQLLLVGTSAGGARAKAVITWNQTNNEIRSGQDTAPPGFSYWLLKFDGVTGNKDKESDDTDGYCAIEYAYFLMARDAGIQMEDCRLFEENNRRHFMTRRFDRTSDGGKIHMLSLGAIAHFDFNNPAAHSYEQAFEVMRRLSLPMEQLEQLFIRMVFNILARNHDDHVKNTAFLMNRNGEWRLSPAFDITFSYNPKGMWTSRHQMSMNHKRDGFILQDFHECGRTISLKQGRAGEILEMVSKVVSRWPYYAEAAVVATAWVEQIQQAHRNIPDST
jgi:serine/threonine-protein kinase HipA